MSANSIASAQEKARRLFDGETLKGWKYDAKHWRVENGSIVGEIPRGQTLSSNTWLIWSDGVLKDFELRLQVRLSGLPAANSGIQIRCQADSPGHVSGYQADLDMGATWLGRIYDEHGRALITERGSRVLIDKEGQRKTEVFSPANLYAPIFREGEWNDYRIVGIGNRIAVFVNGTLFADLVDKQEGECDLSGQLAFQLHSGPETRVEFRDVELEELAADDDRLGAFAIEQVADSEKPSGTLPIGNAEVALNLDFEKGDLSDWTATGEAFKGQPVARDTIGQRWAGQVSNKQGDYFIGGYELSRSDSAQGTLTSGWFQAKEPYASFLIAGGSSPATRVDVFAKGEGGKEELITSASGQQREQMRRVVVDLRAYQDREIAVRLVDASSGGWGHLNFDDFRMHQDRPTFQEAVGGPLFNPMLHHLQSVEKPTEVTGNTIAKMSVPEGFHVDLIAAEPRLHQPMAFTFDARGRLWVVEGHCYPTKRPEGEGLDRILIFEDADHDGSFESQKVFTEGLNLVSGFQVGHGGVWVGAAPELLFIPDRDGDDVPDQDPIVLLDGWGYADTHETLNSFTWGPDGWLYGNQGVFNQSRIGKPGCDERTRVKLSAGVWRYHPVRHEFEVFAHGGSNQWGLDFDAFGQLFMTHCRSNWGRGSTTHVIQGAHYWTQLNNGYAPFISANPVAGITELRNYMLASARYGHGEGGAGKRGSRALYGGHSHVGTMLYLGDNWPEEYRNHLFTHNLHGHRMNHQVNEVAGSGFNTVHAGFDVFQCSDPQYIGVDLQYGPDGAVYFSDWYDPRHCHSPHTEQWQRGNGRMYRMSYQGFQPAKVNYAEASDLELVEAQLHRNDWHVRMARLVLAERAAAGEISDAAIRRLREIVTTNDDATRRLRALWCLHGTGLLDLALAKRALEDSNEYVRGWAVQLVAESSLAGKNSLLPDLLVLEKSPIVRRYYASAAGQLDTFAAWETLETLAMQSGNAQDRNLPKLIWHSLAEFVAADVVRAVDLIDRTPIPLIKQSLRWYLPQVSDEARELMVSYVADLGGEEQVLALKLMAAGLASSRNLKQPDSWGKLAEKLYQDPRTRAPAIDLGVVFNDKQLYAEMREQLAGGGLNVQQRRQALGRLANSRDEANLPILMQHVDTPELRLLVLRQLGRYDNPQATRAILERLPDLQGAEREAAMEALCGRAKSALALLEAIAAGEIQKEVLTGYYARQMASLGNESVNEQLTKQWGRLTQSSAERQAEMAELVATYKKAPLWAYNRSGGAVQFKKICASCHVEQNGVARIGPKLDGTGAKGIEYIVENILDPNAVIGEDFLARNILTEDDRVITGVVIKETDTALTIRTSNSTEVVAKDEVLKTVVSKNSFMPEGLLNPLSERERIELLMYLMNLK